MKLSLENCYEKLNLLCLISSVRHIFLIGVRNQDSDRFKAFWILYTLELLEMTFYDI